MRMPGNNFFQELRRRNVYKVAVSYGIVGWLILQIGAIVFPTINAPEWVMQVLLFFVVIGFPVALLLAWAFEMSPQGIIRTTSIAAEENPYPDRKKKPLTSMVAIGVLLLIVVGQFGYNKYRSSNPADLGMNENAATMVTEKTIAVLPFRNDSPDKDNQYFADGMMDEILNHLQKIAELGVKSRTAVEIYRDSPKSFAAIAGELDVAFLLEGAVRKYGDKFRITTQLIEVKSGNHLWSDTYDGVFSDTIFVVQGNIAKKIAASLNTVITPDEEKRIDRIPTTYITAYDLYVRANHERKLFWSTLDREHLKMAHDLLDKALKIDPEYLMAISAKGETFNAERNYDSTLVYADKLISLVPDLHLGYGLAGDVYLWSGKTDLAMKYYLRAIELPPQDRDWQIYHSAIGLGYLIDNKVLQALPYLQKGLKISNEEPSGGGYAWTSAAYLNIGDYKKAEAYGRKAAERGCFGIGAVPDSYMVQGRFQEAFQFADSICHQVHCEMVCFNYLFRTSYLLGEYEKAEQYFLQRRKFQQEPDDQKVIIGNHEIGYVYYKQGRMDESNKVFGAEIEKLEPLLDNEHKNAYLYLSRIYALQGDNHKSLKYLSEYSRLGFSNGWHDFIVIDPFFESLRDDPEFQAIVKQAQEEKTALRAQVRQMEERGELDL